MGRGHGTGRRKRRTRRQQARRHPTGGPSATDANFDDDGGGLVAVLLPQRWVLLPPEALTKLEARGALLELREQARVEGGPALVIGLAAHLIHDGQVLGSALRELLWSLEAPVQLVTAEQVDLAEDPELRVAPLRDVPGLPSFVMVG